MVIHQLLHDFRLHSQNNGVIPQVESGEGRVYADFTPTLWRTAFTKCINYKSIKSVSSMGERQAAKNTLRKWELKYTKAMCVIPYGCILMV
uniref:Putative ovule protein n=1 Tax=Solanum chacoense TaxID=4108 RepID=A0A0V0IGV4_SOLCH